MKHTCEACGQALPVDTMTFDRSDLDRIAYLSGDLSKRGTEPTLAEEARQRGFFGRLDIAMANVGPYDSPKFEQYVVEPGRDGKPIWGKARRYFTKAEQAEIVELNVKLNEALRAHDLFDVAYRHR